MSPEGGDPGRAAWRSAGARAVPTDKAALGHVAASRGRCSCPPRGPRAAAEAAEGPRESRGPSPPPPSTPEAPPGPAGAAEAPARAPPWRMLGPPTPGPAMAPAGLAPQRLLLREPRPLWPPRRPHRSARPPPPGPSAPQPGGRLPGLLRGLRTGVECDRPRFLLSLLSANGKREPLVQSAPPNLATPLTRVLFPGGAACFPSQMTSDLSATGPRKEGTVLRGRPPAGGAVLWRRADPGLSGLVRKLGPLGERTCRRCGLHHSSTKPSLCLCVPTTGAVLWLLRFLCALNVWWPRPFAKVHRHACRYPLWSCIYPQDRQKAFSQPLGYPAPRGSCRGFA